MRFNKILFLLCGLNITLFAQNPSSYISGAAASELNSTIAKTKASSGNGKGSLKDTFLDTVIYNDVFSKTSLGGAIRVEQSFTRAKANGIGLKTPASDYLAYATATYKKQTADEQARLKKEQEEALKASQETRYFVGGFCTATTETHIIRASGFSQFTCLLDFGGGTFRRATVFSGVYPDYKREMLIGIPIYASFRDSGKRATLSGVVMNQNKTSLNIANIVETFKIRRLVTQYGLAISNVAFSYASAYLQAVQASNTSNQVDYITTTNADGTTTTTPVNTTNIAKPEASDYLAIAGISILDRLFAIGADNVLQDTSPLFTISKGQRVWIEGVLDFNPKSGASAFGAISQEIKTTIQNNNNAYNATTATTGGTTTTTSSTQ